MPALQVDTFVFTFTPVMTAQWYDKWQHYTMVWNAPPGGRKAVDVVAVEGVATPIITWLIEAKDFRVITNPPKPSRLAWRSSAPRSPRPSLTRANFGPATDSGIRPRGLRPDGKLFVSSTPASHPARLTPRRVRRLDTVDPLG